MKTIVLILSVIIVSMGLNLLIPALPWYTPVIVAFIAGLIAGRLDLDSFMAGFMGVGLFWALILLMVHFRNDGVITEQISGIFAEQMGGNVAPFILLMMVPLLGGLLGGFSALSGKLFSTPSTSHRSSRRKKKNSGSYKLKLN